MKSILDASELCRIRGFKELRRALRVLLLNTNVLWRGATVSELCDVMMMERDTIRKQLIDCYEFEHCPACDRWFVNRGVSGIVPRGCRHNLYYCPHAIPADSREGQLAVKRSPRYFINNPQRIMGIALRRVPLICQTTVRKPESHALKIFSPTPAT